MGLLMYLCNWRLRLCRPARSGALRALLWEGALPHSARRFGRLSGVTIVSHSVRCRYATMYRPSDGAVLVTIVIVIQKNDWGDDCMDEWGDDCMVSIHNA